MASIDNLPETLLDSVCSFLSITDRCRLLCSSRRLWAVKDDLEKRIKILRVECSKDARLVNDQDPPKRHPTAWPQHMFQNISVHTLELSRHCSDWFLRLMAEQQLFPLLRHIGMKRSSGVTNQGLNWLSQHTGNGIESIDITFCENTSFSGTFPLRDRLGNSLRVLRRQPKWLDGKFHTPFSEDSDIVEAHTYFADGTFSFTRENQSRGFVMELSEWDGSDDYLADKLQYTNFEPLLGWPTWTVYSYRPGVCLLKLPDHKNENGEVVRTVLVGQNLRGLRPPKIRTIMMEIAADLPVGTSTYFRKEEDGEIVRVEARPASGGIMVSKMRVFPLDSLMPPDDLVQDCRTACQMMRDLGEDVVNSGENYLNEALS